MLKISNKIEIKLVYYTPPWLPGWLASASHGGKISEIDKNDALELTKKLLKWGHLEPLETSLFVFDCKIPLFVANQLNRHRIGCGRTQQSLRYCKITDIELYYHDGNAPEHDMPLINSFLNYIENIASKASCIQEKEQINRMLPSRIMIKYRCYFNFRSFMHLLEMRDKNNVQPETRYTVQLMKSEIIKTDWGDLLKSIE
ncbi:MAG: FAD-dependent thymidylate synthase [Candidatus Bilamarchaeaceae archaeon]